MYDCMYVGGTLGIGSVFSTLGIIPSEFWYPMYIYYHITSVHAKKDKMTLQQLTTRK